MSPVHLVAIVHGLWGDVTHVAELAKVLLERAKQTDAELKVLVAETNQSGITIDGIDWGGERVAKEVLDKVGRLEGQGHTVTRFSIVGYSLGGLIARYVVGILHQQKFFEKIRPGQFNTFAAPHVGLPRFDTFMNKVTHTAGPKLLGRTGEQFYATDKWSATGRPLLEVLADPNRIFYQALALFPRFVVYGNAVNDVTVPYVTACIELDDPFVDYNVTGLIVKTSDQYPHLVESFTLPDIPPTPATKPRVFSRAWFKSVHILPPFLQVKFPFNVIIFVFLPVLIPLGMSLFAIRLAVKARASRARLQLLESDPTSSQRLLNVLAKLEDGVEKAVGEAIDSDSQDVTSKGASHPVLTSLQRKLVTTLNTLPNLHKERAFFPDFGNSHGLLVCREPKKFPVHMEGKGTISHWADNFVV